MAYSYIEYTANSSANSGKDYTYSFPAVAHDTTNIKVTVGGSAVSSSNYSVVQGTVTLTAAPGAGSAPLDAALSSSNPMRIYRETNRTAAEVVFSANSVIQDEDLNTSTDQGRFLALEALDRSNDAIVLDLNDLSQYDIEVGGVDKRISGVATPTGDDDAANKAYADANVATTNDYRLTTISYATRTDGNAQTYSGGSGSDTSDESAKNWAVGIDPTHAPADGSSKEWATSTGAQVDTSEYSSKEYAIGDLTASGGSAKAWAVDASSPNGSSDKSAKTLATEAATSATNASASEVAAKLSASAVANAFDSFNDTYLGQSSDAVVLTASSSSGLLITSAAHGLVDTQVIRVVNSGGGLPGNLSAGTDYYVRDKTTNNFKLATSSGGTAIAYSSAGSGTNTWYYADFATPSSSSWAKHGSTITVASNVGVRVGQVVTGSGISSSPTKPNVLSIDGTAIVISENMAAAGSSVAVTFQNRGVYGAFDTTKDGPSTDNDGDALADGMIYFNTTDNAMKVYNTTGSAWVSVLADTVSASSGGTFSGDVTHNGNVIMATNKKIQQKGAFMQSSTHQALFLGA